MNLSTDQLRVTSVKYFDNRWSVFCGVPLVERSSRSRSAKHVIIVKAKPNILPMKPEVGQHWRITGPHQVRNIVHGDFQMKEHHFINPSRCEVTLPHDGEAIIRFIAKEPSFKGIGGVKARELWMKFGHGLIAILQSEDVVSLKYVLTEQVAQTLIEGFQKYRNLKYVTWFSDHHIPPQIQQRLLKYHQEDSIDEIKKNPYRLVTFGMTFEEVDKISDQYFVIAKTDRRRLVAAVEYSLQKYSQRGGHTLAYYRDLSSRVSKLLGCESLAEAAFDEAVLHQICHFNEHSGAYHHSSLFIMEHVVAKRLIGLSQDNFNDQDERYSALSKAIEDVPYKMTFKQQDAVKNALLNKVSCITGGAGTGKTTVLKAVLRAYQSMGYVIHPMALSGRAAVRITESAGFEAMTIAKFLKGSPIETSGRNIIVIDEASMLDLGTMYRIVIHTDPSVHFLFVGDPNQLPPIGAGLVLSDVVKSEVIANTSLDIVQRQDASTGIPEYSNMICLGRLPEQLSSGGVYFYETSTRQIAEYCAELYGLSNGSARIVSATKKMNDEVNLLCQKKFNLGGKALEFVEFGDRYGTDLKCGDPVLFTQNDYEANVQNGTLGVLISVEQRESFYGVVKLEGCETEIRLTRTLLDSIMLGYSITLHKAQGSQFNTVVVALSESDMIDRAWLYTAITRAEKEVHIVGTERKMRQSTERLSTHHQRKTYLSELLKQSQATVQ